MKTIKLTVLTVTAIAGLLELAGCGSSSNARPTPQSEPTPVRVEAIDHTTSGLPIRAVGCVDAKEELELAFKTGGIIEHVYVDEGDQVRKGQRLASLRLTEINAALSQAQHSYEKAERDFDRYQRLFADSLITLEQMQNVATAREVAKASFEAVRFNREHAEIIAPADGRILRRMFDDNELVASGSPIIAMSGYDRGWIIRASLADRDLVRVKLGDSAVIELDAFPGSALSGTVSEIGAAPNPANGTYEIEISVTSSRELVCGLIAKVAIMIPLSQSLAVVPVEALVSADGRDGFVFVLSDDQHTASRIPVTIAYMHGAHVAVANSLEEYASVITAGAAKLTDGSPVRIVR